MGPSPSDPDDRLTREQIRLLVIVAVVSVIIAAVVVVIVAGSSGGAKQRSASAAGTADTGTATASSPTGTGAASPGTSGTGTTGTGTNGTTGTIGSATTRSPTGGGALTPAGGPVPAGLAPQTFSAISDSTWWLMGTAPCGSPPCTSIVRTSDGGRSFVGIPAPRTDDVTDLRFANAEDGYAYGQELWATHDGGMTWTQVPGVGAVQGVAIGGGYVYAASSEGIFRSPLSRDSFTVVHDGVAYGVWTHGASLFATLAGASGDGQVLVTSTDDGGTFASHPAPAGTVACANVESLSDAVVWAACATGTEGGLWRSVDGGAHWTGLDPAAGSGEGQPNSAAFAEASANTAVYGSTALYRTTDGGTTWSAVPGVLGGGDISVTYLGFTDPTHGVAIVADQGDAVSSHLEVTTDGGASYHAVTISAG